MGTLNLAVPLVLYEKSRIMLVPDFAFTVPNFIFITNTLTTIQHLHTYAHPKHFLKFTVTNPPGMRLAEVVKKLKMDHSSTCIVYSGAQMPKLQ